MKLGRFFDLRAIVAAGMALCLVGCGGGGGGPGGSSSPAPTPLPAPVCTIAISGDGTIAAGKTANATAVPSCSGAIGDIVWSQVSGPTVDLLDTHSPTIAFESATMGDIALRAAVTMADGTVASATTTVTVTARPAGSFVTVRADHSVREGVDTSLRAWSTLADGETLTSITWTQVSGPTVAMNTSTSQVLFFKSPTVPSTTIADVLPLKFRATMLTSSGRQDSDEVTVSVERSHNATDAVFASAARVHAYRPASKYAGVLARCTYDPSLYATSDASNSLCLASTLPLLDSEAGNGNVPSVAQVMDRVLVSHDYLGANFEQFLTTQDVNGDFRRMLSAVTAVVIGSHVRPSFYQPVTGAIYLDANNLWLTPQQRDIVTEVPDYRSNFDAALNYTGLLRLVKNNAYARRSLPVTQRLTRTVDELTLTLGDLLYHELGHAGDFFPPTQRNLNANLSIYGNVVSRINNFQLPSDALATTYPLRSAEMLGLGQVLYRGATANALQISYSAADVGRFFSSDDASYDYAYSIYRTDHSREDLAMLMEEFMLSYRQGVQFDIAYTNKALPTSTANDLIVAWGQRGRINDPAVNPRIKLVLARIAPWINPAAVDSLPAPLLMQPGRSWFANVVLGPTVANSPARMLHQDSPEVAALRLQEDINRPRH